MVINRMVGVHIPIIRIGFPIKGGMTIPNIGKDATEEFDMLLDQGLSK